MADKLPMTETMYYILLALERPEDGCGLSQRISALSGGRLTIGPGTLYGHLTRMQKEGLVGIVSSLRQQRTFVLTEAGKLALLEEYARLKRQVQDGASLEGLI